MNSVDRGDGKRGNLAECIGGPLDGEFRTYQAGELAWKSSFGRGVWEPMHYMLDRTDEAIPVFRWTRTPDTATRPNPVPPDKRS